MQQEQWKIDGGSYSNDGSSIKRQKLDPGTRFILAQILSEELSEQQSKFPIPSKIQIQTFLHICKSSFFEPSSLHYYDLLYSLVLAHCHELRRRCDFVPLFFVFFRTKVDSVNPHVCLDWLLQILCLLETQYLSKHVPISNRER
jgi:hypothetical protein